MKKVLTIFLALVMIFSLLTACAAPGTATSGTSSSSEPAKTGAAGNDKKVAFITSQRVGDGGPVDLMYNGVKAACDKNGAQYHVVEAQRGEYEESMVAMIQDGYGLIVALFPELKDAVDSVAKQYPNTKFLHLVCANMGDNIQGVCGYEQESSFVMGALAAYMTKSKKIGYVGGVDNPDINRYLDGFKEGIAYVDTSIEVQASWIGSFEDPAKAKELALVHYNNGCDIVWGSGGKSALGLFEAVKEKGTGFYLMGCTTDNNDRAPGQVLASHIEMYDKVSQDAVDEYIKGNFKPGLNVFTLTTGYMEVKLATDAQCKIPADVRQKVKEINDKVLKGEIKVKCMPTHDAIIAQFKK